MDLPRNGASYFYAITCGTAVEPPCWAEIPDYWEKTSESGFGHAPPGTPLEGGVVPDFLAMFTSVRVAGQLSGPPALQAGSGLVIL